MKFAHRSNTGKVQNVETYTPDMILCQALGLADSVLGLSTDHLFNEDGKACHSKCDVWFTEVFGPSTTTAAEVLIDLQTIAQLDMKKDKTGLGHFLAVLFFVKSYNSKYWKESVLNKYRKTILKWARFYIPRIAALRGGSADMIGSMVDINNLTVGTVCYNTNGNTMSADPGYHSHKLGGHGLKYEIWRAPAERMVWVSGPVPAGCKDMQTIQSTRSDEMFVQMVREYQCLSKKGPFCNALEWHKLCFLAVAALCQYQFEASIDLMMFGGYA